MDEALLAAYRATDYRVRLATGGWASIRIDQPLPAALAACVADQPWGFITAWNPRSHPQPRHVNRAAQRALLRQLRTLPQTVVLRAGVGVAQHGAWREPSLFVVGLDITALDRLAHIFAQHAYVHSRGPSAAQLRWTAGL